MYTSELEGVPLRIFMKLVHILTLIIIADFPPRPKDVKNEFFPNIKIIPQFCPDFLQRNYESIINRKRDIHIIL